MSVVLHLIAVVIYAMAAAAVGAVLPRLVSGMAIEVGILSGAVVFLVLALAHQTLARTGQARNLAAQLSALSKAHDDHAGEFGLARDQFGQIRDALLAYGNKKSADGKELDKVVAEVKLLQGLVDELSGDAADTRARAGGGGSSGGPGPAGAQPALEPDQPGSERSLAPVAGGLDDQAILEIIRDGLKRDRVDLVLQPIVSLPQRKRRYVEAFTRIRAEDGSIIVPQQYIGIAEREGLITAIDNMLLFRCVQLLRRPQVRGANIGFFCNISPYTLADRTFFGEFVDFMRENAELASDLIFEFSQATVAARDEDILTQLARLSSLGFRFSMDQVASLALDYGWISRHHFRFIKIEAQTLLDELRTPSGELDIDAQDLKRTLERHGMNLIVEKIETEPDLLEILDLQVDYGQGYLFGEPQSARSA